MVSSLTFNIHFYEQGGGKLEVPKEWEPVQVHLDLDIEDWEQCNFFINNKQVDLMVKKIEGEKKIVADINRFNAGHYKARIHYKDQFGLFTFTVIPSKISQSAYTKMLEEIAFGLPVDISVSLNEMGAFSGINFTNKKEYTLAQEYNRIKKVILGRKNSMGLINILETISKAPHHILKNRDVLVNSTEIRRPNVAKIAESFSYSKSLDEYGRPLKMIDSRVELSFNVYENQLIKLFVEQVTIKLRKINHLFGLLGKEILFIESQNLQKELNNIIYKSKFLNDVNVPRNFILKTTMVLLNIPVYKVALTEFIAFQKVVTVNINDRDIEAPLENTPYLYQKWGTLKLLNILLEKAQCNGFRVRKQQLLHKGPGGITLNILPNGKPTIVLYHPEKKIIVKFIPERSYNNKGKPLKSISFTQRPDIAIEVTLPNNRIISYIFDPKYKLNSESDNENTYINNSKPKKVDIDKMHAYRDAIRSINGDRVVRFASILYPGETIHYEDGIKAIQAYPEKDSTFIPEIEEILTYILEGR